MEKNAEGFPLCVFSTIFSYFAQAEQAKATLSSFSVPGTIPVTKGRMALVGHLDRHKASEHCCSQILASTIARLFSILIAPYGH